MTTIYIDGNSLNLEKIEEVAYKRTPIALTEACIQKVNKCRDYVEKIIDKGELVYGLNTGFGKLSSIAIPRDNIAELQVNLIRSHYNFMKMSHDFISPLMGCNCIFR